MLISLEKAFLFVHVPKTAGSSITSTLKEFSVPKNRTLTRRLTSHLPFAENAAYVYLRTHDTAVHARKKLGAIQFNALFKFAVVRNPYSHAASYYRFLRQRPNHPHHEKIKSMTFIEFLEDRANTRKRIDQSFYVSDASGNIIVDRLLRFENLAFEFSCLCDELDIPALDLPKRNITVEMESAATYCTKSRNLVESIYKRDFENFGY